MELFFSLAELTKKHSLAVLMTHFISIANEKFPLAPLMNMYDSISNANIFYNLVSGLGNPRKTKWPHLEYSGATSRLFDATIEYGAARTA